MELEENTFLQLLGVQGPNIEFLASLPLHQLLLLGVDERVQALTQNDAFWKKWVQKNLFPRHTDTFIESIPGQMKWRYYARLYGVIEGSKLYVATKEGDMSRFFPCLELPGIQKVKYFGLNYIYLVDGQLCYMPKLETEAQFYKPSSLIWFQSTANVYITDFVILTKSPIYIALLLLLDKDGNIYHSNLISSFLAVKKMSSPTQVNKIAFADRVVAIAEDRVVTETGEVYGFSYTSNSENHIQIADKPLQKDCVFVEQNGTPMITLNDLSECRVISSYDKKPKWDPRFSHPMRVMTEWNSQGENHTYFYNYRRSHTKGVPVNEFPKNKIDDPFKIVCPKEADEPIKLTGIRGWETNRAAWTLSGQLYTAPNHNGGNGIYTSSVDVSMPAANLRPAVGIPDFVVKCSHTKVKYAQAVAVALPRSQALARMLQGLQDAEGVVGLRALASLLHYPSGIVALPQQTLKKILGHEPFSIVNKIPFIPHIREEIEALPERAAELSELGKELGILHFSVKTKMQLQYAIAEKKLLQKMPELAKGRFSDSYEEKA